MMLGNIHMQNEREIRSILHRNHRTTIIDLCGYAEKKRFVRRTGRMMNQSSSKIWKVFNRTVSMTRFCQPESIRLAPEAPIRVGPKQMAMLPAVIRLLLACSWTLFKCYTLVSTVD